MSIITLDGNRLDDVLSRVDGVLEHRDERRASTVLREVGLEWAACEGKRVLDVGAGGASVERAALRRGIDILGVDSDREGAMCDYLQHVVRELCCWVVEERRVDEAFEGLHRVPTHGIARHALRLRNRVRQRLGVEIPSLAEDVPFWDRRYLMGGSPAYAACDAENLERPDHTFDLAISHATPPMAYDFGRNHNVMARVLRLLAPGGAWHMGPGVPYLKGKAFAQRVDPHSPFPRNGHRSAREVEEELLFRELFEMPELSMRYVRIDPVGSRQGIACVLRTSDASGR